MNIITYYTWFSSVWGKCPQMSNIAYVLLLAPLPQKKKKGKSFTCLEPLFTIKNKLYIITMLAFAF